MFTLKIAEVIQEYLTVVFLYVLSIDSPSVKKTNTFDTDRMQMRMRTGRGDMEASR